LKDLKLVDKWQQLSEKHRKPWDHLTIAEQEQFRMLFKRYPREQVLPGIGSSPVIGRYAA
jgi:hypothetical protein